jgi:chromosome segregation protein
VSDSQFLGAVELGLNPQFNAFIGGRGTGKSSLLEYIRWALCDDPFSVAESAELPNFQKRRKALVDGTLRPCSAKVSVFYKRNEVIYRIERTITDKGDSIVVFDPTGTAQAMTPEQIRREFPIVSYAQKQLSCVGTLPEEINRLITDPVKEPLATIQDKIEKQILPQLKEQRARELRLAALNAQLGEIAVTIKSKKEQIQALQTQLQSLTPEQQAIIQAHDVMSQQDQWLTRGNELPQKTADLLKQARNQVNALGAVTVPEQLPDRTKVQSVVDDANSFFKKVLGQLDALVAEAESGAWLNTASKQIRDELRKAFTEHQAEYDKCVRESAKNQKQLDEIQSLNKQIAELETKQATLESERNTLKVVHDEVGGTHWQAFLQAIEARADLLRSQCALITQQAQHEFKPYLAFCGDERLLRTTLDALVQRRNVKDSDQKIGSLAKSVCTAPHPVKQWAEVMTELDSLHKSKGSETLPPAPLLKAAGFTDANLESIRAGVTEDALEQIRFLNIGDQIEFAFRMGKKPDGTDNYIPFDSASPGQQATCLLRTLLAQSGAPLFIDQPEEDLDNEQIHVLSERIAETKHNRQLLFVSHNANIVVNGDAELVVCFGYREDSGDNTRGKIDPVGSIDCTPVREMITKIMEGGRQAFELRKDKYGF